MSTANEALIVMTTVEKSEDGERLAQWLVEQKLAACVQVLPPMISIYRWQNKIERASEHLLLIKTTRAAFPVLEARLKKAHPYQTAEIIAVPVVAGSEEYLAWLTELVRPQV
ncbi:MAG TPA: divalent-cation tolerance protein CutA [Blastocatellia bacterium]|nr:divalent-cation tolerance protein CutA [Blastocatellia bacterium]